MQLHVVTRTTWSFEQLWGSWYSLNIFDTLSTLSLLNAVVGDRLWSVVDTVFAKYCGWWPSLIRCWHCLCWILWLTTVFDSLLRPCIFAMWWLVPSLMPCVFAQRGDLYRLWSLVDAFCLCSMLWLVPSLISCWCLVTLLNVVTCTVFDPLMMPFVLAQCCDLPRLWSPVDALCLSLLNVLTCSVFDPLLVPCVFAQCCDWYRPWSLVGALCLCSMLWLVPSLIPCWCLVSLLNVVTGTVFDPLCLCSMWWLVPSLIPCWCLVSLLNWLVPSLTPCWYLVSLLNVVMLNMVTCTVFDHLLMPCVFAQCCDLYRLWPLVDAFAQCCDCYRYRLWPRWGLLSLLNVVTGTGTVFDPLLMPFVFAQCDDLYCLWYPVDAFCLCSMLWLVPSLIPRWCLLSLLNVATCTVFDPLCLCSMLWLVPSLIPCWCLLSLLNVVSCTVFDPLLMPCVFAQWGDL
jgi:hypothetical protein